MLSTECILKPKELLSDMSNPKRPPRKLSTGIKKTRDYLLKEMTSGRIRSGTRLPKFEFLRQTLHVSPNEIQKALRQLCLDKYVYRKGRFLYAGRPVERARNTTPQETPVVLVACRNERQWSDAGLSEHTFRFVEQFHQEVERRGWRILAVGRRNKSKQSPGGIQYLNHTIKNLKNRCMGILLAATPDEMTPFKRWPSAMAATRLPVLWFDRNGYGRVDGLNDPAIIRLHCEEESIVRVAVNHALINGHSRFLIYLGNAEISLPWVQRRISLLSKYLDNSGKVSVVTNRNKRKLLDRVGATPQVIFAIHDTVARPLYSLLTESELLPGKDVSVISFDNSPSLRPLPIDTVDFGFEKLGYWAFHAIIRDLPLPMNRTKDIASEPYVVNRGSVLKVI